MFRIHELSSTSGVLSSIYLHVADEQLLIVSDAGTWPVPEGALSAVLARFGAPFDEDARCSLIATMQLPLGGSLRHVRHLAGYDVIARDYLVYQHANGEALCALAATVAAALLHLGQANAARG